jgi:hypothetical protein
MPQSDFEPEDMTIVLTMQGGYQREFIYEAK